MSRAASRSAQIRKPAVVSSQGLVSSSNRIASEIGVSILAKGGNAIDAAIATSFALGVVEPWMSGLGGGGYMIVRRQDDDHAQVIDFGMRAPSQLCPDDYPVVGGEASDLFPWPVVKNDANIFGAKAIAIPGQVAGMSKAHASYGSLGWKELLMPAVYEAEKGLLVDWYTQLIISGSASSLARCNTSKAIYLNDDGTPKASAWTALGQNSCDQSTLAKTLKDIAEKGADYFYQGALAEQIVADLRELGGRHILEDFTNYKAKIVKASELNYKGHKIFSTPEMTAGPTLERVFENLTSWQHTGAKPTAEDFAAFDSAIRKANEERLILMGDNEYEQEPSCTTHFNVVDSEGTMVSVTQTLLSIFGSRTTLPNSGMLMNNGIMWFNPEIDSPNSIGPGKRCLANMCPTLLERADGVRFALGAAGGRKIMPAVVQLTSYLLDFQMDLEQAMHEPRIDSSLAHTTIADEALSEEVKSNLSELVKSVEFAPRTTYPYNFACPTMVARQNTKNSGVAEVMSYWGDVVSEEGV